MDACDCCSKQFRNGIYIKVDSRSYKFCSSECHRTAGPEQYR